LDWVSDILGRAAVLLGRRLDVALGRGALGAASAGPAVPVSDEALRDLQLSPNLRVGQVELLPISLPISSIAASAAAFVLASWRVPMLISLV